MLSMIFSFLLFCSIKVYLRLSIRYISFAPSKISSKDHIIQIGRMPVYDQGFGLALSLWCVADFVGAMQDKMMRHHKRTHQKQATVPASHTRELRISMAPNRLSQAVHAHIQFHIIAIVLYCAVFFSRIRTTVLFEEAMMLEARIRYRWKKLFGPKKRQRLSLLERFKFYLRLGKCV